MDEIRSSDRLHGRAGAWVADMQNRAEPDSVLEALAKNFQYLLERVEEWEAGTIDPGDLPRFDADVQSVIIYAVWFGTLWELSHPAIYAVLDGERLVGLYGHRENAEERAADYRSYRVQRMSVADGDTDPEDLISEVDHA